MQKKEIQKHLDALFTTSKRDDDSEYIHFTSEYMRPEHEGYAVYQAVSDAAHDSGLTHDFSYEISSRAAQCLIDVEDWDESHDDAMREAIDSSVPIYNSDLTTIYTSNSWAVDEAREEYGSQDSIKDAQMAWYSQISAMVYAIRTNLEPLLDEADGGTLSE